jgi:S1-C subfamily serine protease
VARTLDRVAMSARTDDRVESAIARATDLTVVFDDGRDYGAGMMVAPAEGLILTGWHLIEHMGSLNVTFADGTEVEGRLVAHDPALDLALVEIPPQSQPAPTVGDAILRPGDELFAIGNPRRLAFSVARGVVSYVDRVVNGQKYLQTDVPINEGSAGGPLVNARGELVGVMTSLLQPAHGLSLAVPARIACARFPRLGRAPACRR